MITPEEMRELAQKTQELKIAAEKRAKTAEARAAKEQKEKEIARQMNDWPPYIEAEIRKAAQEGKNNYTFDCGENSYPDPLVLDYLRKEFNGFNPKVKRLKHNEIDNYELGTTKEIWSTGIEFTW